MMHRRHRPLLLSLTTLALLSGCDKTTDNSSVPPAPEPEATPLAETAVTPAQTAEPIMEEEATAQQNLIPNESSLVPFNSSWHYPQLLNRRPGNGLVSKVNPPRFSWPVVKSGVFQDPFNNPIPSTVYTFQIAKDPEFTDIAFETTDTPYCFYNALPVFEHGTYFWRIGYGAAPAQEWTKTWSFIVDESSVEWDRTVINSAVELLSTQKRPRSGPAGGDWEGFRTRLQEGEKTKEHYASLIRNADRILGLDWWNNLPASDVVEYTDRNSKVKWVRMLKDATIVAYAYRLTGDEKYAESLDNILHMARWPRGGGLSPEYLGGETKMPSQAPELFAVVYDWFYNDLSEADRTTLLDTITWRLDIMYFDPESKIWRMGPDRVPREGMTYAFSSHPYQNYTWTVPAILLTAGDCDVANKLVPLALHYLTGVTTPEGPDEGYNEGHGYSSEKGGTMLKAAIVTEMLLPEIDFGKNPVVDGFADWMIFMFPGMERLPWGDSWMRTTRGAGGPNLRYVSYLTGSPKAQLMWNERAGGSITGNIAGQYSRPWFDFLAYEKFNDKLSGAQQEITDETLFLAEAGWIFAQSQPIQTIEDYFESTGMQMQMRPRGSYSHSFPSDGAFVWYAHGELLTCGGGWRSWGSQVYSRDPSSQNTLLVDGRGHRRLNNYEPPVPYIARPIAYEEGEDYLYWSADLTSGYFGVEGVERVHRHVVFLDREHFVIFDDLKLTDSTEPAQFSWLFHIYQDVPVEIDSNSASFNYSIGEVNARVAFANTPSTLEIQNRIKEQAYINPFTGKDSLTPDMKNARSRGIFKKYLTEPLNANALWVTSAEASRDFHFLSVLTASKNDGAPMPELKFTDEKRVTLVLEDGSERSVSFDPELDADIIVDVELLRSHSKKTGK